MDSIPPTREELERLPLPDLLSRAQQLGADVSYVHDRSEIIDVLAGQRRQLLTRYAEELQKFKIRLEGQHQELDISKQQYQTTYDRVEQAVTDRFAQLHDQLLRKEVEVRGHLAYLKNSGDEVITDCSSAMGRELSILDDTLVRCQSRDLDVLDITPASTAITVNVPSLTGRCFEFSDISALDLSGLRISLDLNASSRSMQMEPPYAKREVMPGQSTSAGPASHHHHHHHHQQQQQPHRVSHSGGMNPSQTTHHNPNPNPNQNQNPHASFPSTGPSYSTQHPYAPPSHSGGLNATQPGRPEHHGQSAHSNTHPGHNMQGVNREGVDILSFPLDPEIELKQDTTGMSLRMMPDAAEDVVGAKAHEAFSEGVHVWKVRLDNIQESLLGMVDSRDQSGAGAGDGFFWSPIRRDIHGKRGKPSATLSHIPVAQQGDIIKLTYDADQGTVRVAHNNVDRGFLCTELFGLLSPCFIFGRGEGLTLLQ